VLAAGAIALCVGACGSDPAAHTALNRPVPFKRPAIELKSPDVGFGGPLDRQFTCDGAGDPPLLRVAHVPQGTRELALFMYDPDAPGGNFPHWSVYGIAPNARTITPRSGRQGRNGFGKIGYGPPCPPTGDKPHRYVFVVYALRSPIGLPAGASPDAVIAAITPRAVANGTLNTTAGR
jgi:Raf kinase inhibitor-like YbhB/YbcL family protein